MSEGSRRLAFALDVPTLTEAEVWLDRLGDAVGVYKVGLELFIAAGPAAVRAVKRRGSACFLDLKLHDIPTTVARAVTTAAELEVDFLTLHATSGGAALSAAHRAREGSDLRLLAVTALTSLDAAALGRLGWENTVAEYVRRSAEIALDSGVRGFVSSASECPQLKALGGEGTFVVTPGIRPASEDGSASHHDQKRVSTPAMAIGKGSDLLVVGRPIRDARDPLATARSIASSIEAASQELG